MSSEYYHIYIPELSERNHGGLKKTLIVVSSLLSVHTNISGESIAESFTHFCLVLLIKVFFIHIVI